MQASADSLDQGPTGGRPPATGRAKLRALISLTRLDRPVGIYLLLWPMLSALWFAAGGMPPLDILVIFTLGTLLTRSAGCAINDFADRKIDGHVARTRQRPLATGALLPRDALIATAVLMGLAFVLVLMTNLLTIAMSAVACALAVLYPFSKRITDFPQVVLGAAFGFAIPMAFTAITESVPAIAWVLYVSAICWAVAYDTFYAMSDREDDLVLGVRSTATRLGENDLKLIACMYIATFGLLVVAGLLGDRGLIWFSGIALASVMAAREWRRAGTRDSADCFHAFLANVRIGAITFLALVLDFMLFAPDLSSA